jgi:predicted DNA-binding ribbon-helix-helix protein
MNKSHYVPPTPYADSRVISTRIEPGFHKQLRELAAKQDCAVAAVVKTALESYIKANA